MSFRIDRGSGDLHSETRSIELVDKEWHFWVGVYNKDLHTTALYKDGLLDNSLIINQDEILYSTSGMWNMIGVLDTGGWPFGGVIDDVRIYNRALTQTEVTELYNVPEPSTLSLFGMGVFFLRRKK